MEEENAVPEIRKWLRQNKIPGARNDDLFIAMFLRGCEGNVSLARKKLQNYCEMKLSMPEWFSERDPRQQNIRHLLDLGIMLPMPIKDDQGRTTIVVRATINDPKTNPMSDVFKVGMMVIDLAMEEDAEMTKNGIIVIIDLEGVRLAHALQMTPTLVRKAVHSWQNCYPVRVAGIDFINCPPHVDVILNLFRRFAKEKLKRRIRVHAKGAFNPEGTHTKCLPQEYGGTCGPLEQVAMHWAEKVQTRREWFLNNFPAAHEECSVVSDNFQ